MKKINFLLALLAFVAVGLVFTSCGTDEEADPPTLTLVSQADGKITVQAASNEYDLTTLAINAPVNVLLNNLAPATAFAADQVVSPFKFVSGNRNIQVIIDYKGAANDELKLTLTDDNGKATDLTVKFTAAVAETAFAFECTTGKVYNKLGSQKPAWNLETKSALLSDEAADADMWNKTDFSTPGSDMSNGFIVGWDGANGTKFVKTAKGADYDNASVEDAVAAYAAGPAVDNLKHLAQGDVIATKVRGGDKYSLIKVTAVELLGPAKGFGDLKSEADDNISFSYKFGTAAAK